MRGLVRSILRCGMLAALLPPVTALASDAPPESIAVLVEGSNGAGALSFAVEDHLRQRGSTVTAAAEVRAALDSTGVVRPVTDEGAEVLRSELDVERLLVIDTRIPRDSSSILVTARMFEEGRNSRRTGSAAGGKLEKEVLRLVSELVAPATVRRERPEFDDARAQELGLELGYVNSISRREVDDDTEHVDSAELVVAPRLGYFVVRGAQVTVSPMWVHRALLADEADSREDRYSLSVGAAYLFRLPGTLRVGPALDVGLYGRQSVTDDEDGYLRVRELGEIATVAAVAKVPVGSAALFTVTIAGFYESGNADYKIGSVRFDGPTDRHGVMTTVGFSFWRAGVAPR